MTTAVLDPQAADRLAKLCGMFGSAHVGERGAAAAKADALVRSLGLTWFDVITTRFPQKDKVKAPVIWRRKARFCEQHSEYLNERERAFITSILRYHGELSEKQRAWLSAIHQRLRDTFDDD